MESHCLTGNYASALHVLTELVDMIEHHTGPRFMGNYRNILHQCEISRVLLLLILRPTAQRLALPLARVLEKYAWAENSPISGSELVLKLLRLFSCVYV